jgi:hypothetical protein
VRGPDLVTAGGRTWEVDHPAYGGLWANVVPGFLACRVVAGLLGEHEPIGLTVAHWWDEWAADRYATDFGAGRVPCLENGRRWERLVRAAHTARRLPVRRRDFLLGLADPAGGPTRLRELYEAGGSAKEAG